MWFDECLKEEAYKEGFAKGIERAGYKAKRTDDDTLHSDKLDDRVLADIRQSRIVVADFTCVTFMRNVRRQAVRACANGNVHYEAGFAHGLGRAGDLHLPEHLQGLSALRHPPDQSHFLEGCSRSGPPTPGAPGRSVWTWTGTACPRCLIGRSQRAASVGLPWPPRGSQHTGERPCPMRYRTRCSGGVTCTSFGGRSNKA